MASTFKTFLGDDIANTRTLLHESIPLTGSIVSGETYTDVNNVETNIKTYTHGMFQSVYDYPFQSSSANHIFDITFGHHPDITSQGTYDNGNNDVVGNGGAVISTLDSHLSYSKRNNIYNQMAQVLVGHEIDGSIKKFDTDGRLDQGDKYNSLIFINFARLLQKDEIKKGTFEITFATDATHKDPASAVYDSADGSITITDAGAATDYHINSPAGEYGILKLTATESAGAANGASAVDVICGLVYYQAGVVALTPEIFMQKNNASHAVGFLEAFAQMTGTGADVYGLMNATQDEFCKGIRQRMLNISFSNTTELNSTIYFCRVGHNDFNYSTNPTYLKEGKILVKETTNDSPVSYITTVGLYSSDNELLAVAKLSEPLRKDPTNDITLRVRLDY